MDIVKRISDLELRLARLESLERKVVAARARLTAALSIPNATYTVINYDSVDLDTHSAITTGAAWKYTAPVGGYYVVHASLIIDRSVQWNPAESAILDVFKNGSRFYSADRRDKVVAGVNEYQYLTGMVSLTLVAGDFVNITGFQTSQVTLPVYTGDSYYSIVDIWRL
jgi:hypothetical protein